METMSFLGVGVAGYHAIHAIGHVISRDESFIAILVQIFVSAKTDNFKSSSGYFMNRIKVHMKSFL